MSARTTHNLHASRVDTVADLPRIVLHIEDFVRTARWYDVRSVCCAGSTKVCVECLKDLSLKTNDGRLQQQSVEGLLLATISKMESAYLLVRTGRLARVIQQREEALRLLRNQLEHI